MHLGHLIEKDFYLLTEKDISNLNVWEQNYREHIALQQFKSFEIGIPRLHQTLVSKNIERFIASNLKVKGSYFVYDEITSKESLSSMINGLEPGHSKHLNILPSADVKYRKISAEFWDLSLQGYEITLYKADNLEEGHKSSTIYSKYIHKGVWLGFTGSPKYSFGLFHKRKLKDMNSKHRITFWITDTCDIHSKEYQSEMAVKLDVLKEKFK